MMYDAPFMITSMAVGVPALLPGRLLLLPLQQVDDELLVDAKRRKWREHDKEARWLLIMGKMLFFKLQ